MNARHTFAGPAAVARRCHRLIPLVALALTTFVALADARELFPEALVSSIHTNESVFRARPGQWDSRIKERSWVMREGDRWHLWYTGFEAGRNGAIRRLGYARSSDGLEWRRHQEGPLITDLWVEDPMVVKAQGAYFMFAEGRGDFAQLLTSPDGVTWRALGRLDVRQVNGKPITGGPYGTPTAYFENDVWWLFYERNDLGVWLARSTDMQTWTNVQDSPVIKPGPDEYDNYLIALDQIVRHDGLYYAFLHGRARKRKSHWTTLIAVSDNLTHWYKYHANPLFDASTDVSSPVLVHDGDRYRLYTTDEEVNVHFMATDQRAEARSRQIND